MPNRADDWFSQAVRNLEQAEASRRDGRHEWACFAAQQAAELAVKALHMWYGQEAWGHVVARLLEDLPSPPPADLIERSKVLDNFYPE
jgi:HEPN domain-containing protein